MSYKTTKVHQNWAIVTELEDELVTSECGEFSTYPEQQSKKGAVVLLTKPKGWKKGDKLVRVKDHRTVKRNGKFIFKEGEIANIGLKFTDTLLNKNGVPTDNLYKVVVC